MSALLSPPPAPEAGEETQAPRLLGLRDRVAIVTGAGSGLGAAIAAELLRAGARVVRADIDRARNCAAAEAVDPQAGRSLVSTCDVSRADDCEEVVEAAVERFGALDIIVNNAGTDVTQALHEVSIEDWDRVLATNLRGPFLLAKAALPCLLEGYDGDGGQIVNIASTASRRAWPNASAYHASKWGLLGLTQALHAELRAQGVRVTSVIAGGMRTPFLLDRFKDIDPAVLQEPANVALAVRFALEMPRGSVVPELMVLPQNETSWP